MSKDAIYFNHDYNARNDPKMVNLRMKYGWEGYGIFWALLEIMREENAMLRLSDCNAFAFQLHIPSDKMQEYLRYFIELKLLVQDNDFLYSVRLLEDFRHMKEKSKKARDSARARWKSGNDANAMQTHSEGNAKEESIGEDSREENIIVDDSIGDNSITKSPPPPKQKKEIKRNQLFKDCEFFRKENFKAAMADSDYQYADLDYYHEAVKNWSAGGGYMKKDWIATAKNWMLRDSRENKLKVKNGTKQFSAADSGGDLGDAVDEYIARRNRS